MGFDMSDITGVWITKEEVITLETRFPMGKVFTPLPAIEKEKLARQVSARWGALNWLPNKEPVLREGSTITRTLDDSLWSAFASHTRNLSEYSGTQQLLESNPAQVKGGRSTFVGDLPIDVRNILLQYIYDPVKDRTGADRGTTRSTAGQISYVDN